MPDRHDAFLATAEIALALEASAKATGAIDSVATTGVCEVFPGAVNSIPSRVRVAMDIRDIDEKRRDGMLAGLDRACKEISARRGVTTQTEIINRDAPAMCDPAVVAALSAACQTHGLAFDSMVSRAYHDSLFMSRICPAAMLFIPCRDGVSHRPDEYASLKQSNRVRWSWPKHWPAWLHESSHSPYNRGGIESYRRLPNHRPAVRARNRNPPGIQLWIHRSAGHSDRKRCTVRRLRRRRYGAR